MLFRGYTVTRYIHIPLSSAARDSVGEGQRNQAGKSLRDWLISSLRVVFGPSKIEQPTLFGTTLAVEDDVPVLLGVLGRESDRSTEDLVEAWALEAPSANELETSAPKATTSTRSSNDVEREAFELIDLAETLFEETISDVEQRFGAYPQGKQAGASAAEIYRALRSLLKIVDEK